MSLKKLDLGRFVGGAKRSAALGNSTPLYQSISVNGKLVNSLINIGSPVSFISNFFFKKYFRNLPIFNSRQKNCTVSIKLNISGWENQISQEFHVIDSLINLILGIDALSSLKAKLDFSIVSLNKENIVVAPVNKS